MSDEREEPIAPWWHTVAFVAICFALSALGAPLARALQSRGRLVAYAVWLGIELVLLAFVWLGLRLRGQRLSKLTKRFYWHVRAVIHHAGIAIQVAGVLVIVLAVLTIALHAHPAKVMYELRPHGWLELVAYVAVVIVSAIVEELAFRGYLLQQFTAMTATSTGVLAQAFVFGASHGYQGPKMILMFGLIGVVLGVAAVREDSVRPGIFARLMMELAFAVLFVVNR